MVATDGRWREADEFGEDYRGAIAAALVASLVFALGVACFLFARRVSGALETPLAPVLLTLVAASVLGWACAVHLYLRDLRADWLLATVFALCAMACSFPGKRPIDWIVWLTAFAVFALVSAKRGAPRNGSGNRAEQVLQQLTRSRAADRCETIRGILLAEFAPGERTAIIHVAFCPPFDHLPVVEADVIDGPECNVKLAQVLHQGTRLEARLGRASTASERVTIEIHATVGTPLAP